MYKILFLIFVSGISSQIAAQKSTAKVLWNEKEMALEATKGHFQWVLPMEIDSAQISNTAKYYVQSFTYSFNQEKRTMDVYSIGNSDDARRVMLRFLGANQIQTISFNGTDYALYRFYDLYMKIK
jgi:hypothetical protein